MARRIEDIDPELGILKEHILFYLELISDQPQSKMDEVIDKVMIACYQSGKTDGLKAATNQIALAL